MSDDLFARPHRPCPECGGTDGGHYVTCSIMADEAALLAADAGAHECRRAPGTGFCRRCDRFMGDPEKTNRLDAWTDPLTLDRSLDDDPETLIYGSYHARRG